MRQINIMTGWLLVTEIIIWSYLQNDLAVGIFSILNLKIRLTSDRRYFYCLF